MKRVAFTVVLALLAFATATSAEEIPPEAGAPRTVAMFDIFCYRQLPELDTIATIAEAGSFTEITGAELQAYQPQTPAEELRAWRFNDLGSEFVLTTARSRPDDLFKKDVPAFADSIIYSCSLVVPITAEAAPGMLDEMARLMARKPDEAWDQPPLKAHSWCGNTETTLACIHYWAPLPGHAAGLLSVMLSVKN